MNQQFELLVGYRIVSPDDVETIFRTHVPNVDLLGAEIGGVYFLDSDGTLLDMVYVVGQTHSVGFDVGGLISRAEYLGAAIMVFAHSHPHATHSPSIQDETLLTFLHDSLAHRKIRLGDFLIFSQNHSFSARRDQELRQLWKKH